MKIGDRIFDTSIARYGVITREAFYSRDDQWSTSTNCIFVLHYYVKYDHYSSPCSVKAEDIVLAETPEIVAYMKVAVSMRADMYWGMKGVVIESPDWNSALVKLYGYSKPIKFQFDELEPLSEGSDLECWLDSL